MFLTAQVSLTVSVLPEAALAHSVMSTEPIWDMLNWLAVVPTYVHPMKR
jgi:hypothetical protein